MRTSMWMIMRVLIGDGRGWLEVETEGSVRVRNLRRAVMEFEDGDGDEEGRRRTCFLETQ